MHFFTVSLHAIGPAFGKTLLQIMFALHDNFSFVQICFNSIASHSRPAPQWKTMLHNMIVIDNFNELNLSKKFF